MGTQETDAQAERAPAPDARPGPDRPGPRGGEREQGAHLVPLTGTGWATWRDVVLRGTGFPAERVQVLTDPALAAAADAAAGDPALLDAYREEYAAATGRLSAAVRTVAQDPRFREAVAWQNPKLVKLCLDKLAAGEPRNVRGRNHELTAASYLQRYSLKNDTIGFVGPVGWARWTDEGSPLELRVGDEFLARRTVYFEIWAIDAVARTLSADPEVRPWLVPRLFAAHQLEGSTLQIPGRAPVALTPAEAEVLSLVDGVRCVQDVAAEMTWSEFPELGEPAALLATYDDLVGRGLLRLDLVGAIEAFPERTLIRRLERIKDPEARERALGVVGRLVDARDRVAASAGDDVALEAALSALAETFHDITGLDAERRAGLTYAGRTLVYEDTVRGVRVDLGPELREELGRPLALLLDSARWLVAEIGEEYDRLFRELYERRVAQSGNPVVPLAAILSLATPHLFFNTRALSKPVRRAVDEFQRRWAAVLQLPHQDAREVQRSSAELADRVAEFFPPRPVPWVTAIHHSPDFMLAAADEAAVARGDFLLVLGELHLSFNTMESRVFVQQHDDPPSMLAAAETDLGDRRIYGIPSRETPGVSSRVSPPSALLSPGYTYWTIHPESVLPPGPIMPAADLEVLREGDRLIARSRTGSFRAPLSKMFGEPLAAAAVNAFKPVSRGAHSPRITVDRLVIARESWSFPAAEVVWAAVKDESERFLAARSWRIEHGLPERAFYKVPVEDKPTFVDFGSLVYVNIVAKSIRRSAEENGSVSLTEMLPDRDELWLKDAEGARYTSELRILTVDRAAEEA
ncbi:lantibiotic dehydratase [Actinacidiphila sp. DG2A-62]|uniref:lantibiotic dehydratase n=1 Tax=Actinacidiphila sp. DG2A-62 TaxID=3108821 RepID=UPI002DB9C9C5|nr:lantibiotic dehydratase [Actinacidiphila sp. DG2A-62]MEC3993080.1 lantibiotic dehydratase [Actinacidiphila sp. DG2A-62]